jgi:hypothetical protein
LPFRQSVSKVLGQMPQNLWISTNDKQSTYKLKLHVSQQLLKVIVVFNLPFSVFLSFHNAHNVQQQCHEQKRYFILSSRHSWRVTGTYVSPVIQLSSHVVFYLLNRIQWNYSADSYELFYTKSQTLLEWFEKFSHRFLQQN